MSALVGAPTLALGRLARSGGLHLDPAGVQQAEEGQLVPLQLQARWDARAALQDRAVLRSMREVLLCDEEETETSERTLALGDAAVDAAEGDGWAAALAPPEARKDAYRLLAGIAPPGPWASDSDLLMQGLFAVVRERPLAFCLLTRLPHAAELYEVRSRLRLSRRGYNAFLRQRAAELRVPAQLLSVPRGAGLVGRYDNVFDPLAWDPLDRGYESDQAVAACAAAAARCPPPLLADAAAAAGGRGLLRFSPLTVLAFAAHDLLGPGAPPGVAPLGGGDLRDQYASHMYGLLARDDRTLTDCVRTARAGPLDGATAAELPLSEEQRAECLRLMLEFALRRRGHDWRLALEAVPQQTMLDNWRTGAQLLNDAVRRAALWAYRHDEFER